MAEEIIEIGNIPDSVVDDGDDFDEILLLYASPLPIRSGTSMLDAIPVENYPFRMKKASHFEDDEVQLLDSIPKRTRVYKGESSNSKTAEETKPTIPSTFNCGVCFDEKPVADLFGISGCNHSYCKECISRHVASRLQDNVTVINCPEAVISGCVGLLEPYHCQSILPKQVFDWWGDALCEAMILASEKFYCPFKDCSALLIDEKSSRNGESLVESECPDCNRLFCVQCRVPWHSGITCEEFKKLKKDERSNNDIMLMNLAKAKKWMRCSNCKFYVEKSQGCLFMKCRCGYTFCYNCGAPLKDHYCTNCKR